jgi:hypothetical protein
MPARDTPAPDPARVRVSFRLLLALVLLFIAAGCGALLLTGQNHHAEAKIACERFVRHRLSTSTVRFSHETVRDLSSTRHRVTGTAFPAGQAPKRYTCTVSHSGNNWILDGMTGV